MKWSPTNREIETSLGVLMWLYENSDEHRRADIGGVRYELANELDRREGIA